MDALVADPHLKKSDLRHIKLAQTELRAVNGSDLERGLMPSSYLSANWPPGDFQQPSQREHWIHA
jgi:hypothetical protein